MEKWMVYNKKADFQKIGSEFGNDPVIARLIRNRDIQDMKEIRSYLYGTLAEIPSPWKMKDMERAVQILQKKITQKKKIRIIGDYDIDGVTATCILLKGLKRLNANVDTYIPDRVKDGYGMHEQLINKALEDGIDTILTCDNGIAAAAEIEYAKKEGLTVIVTDHHDIPYDTDEKNIRIYKVPEADAVIDHKEPWCEYPCKELRGAGVAVSHVGITPAIGLKNRHTAKQAAVTKLARPVLPPAAIP